LTENQRYNHELKQTMNWVATQPRIRFIGQAVEYAGTGLYDSLTEVPTHLKQEFPVAENFQVGYCTGLALQGLTPICTVPRWNFLLVAADQVVNHLDKLPLMSDGGYCPRVIIRVAVGSERPVDPQDQHKGNFSEAFRSMCRTIEVVELTTPESILPAYQAAMQRQGSSILVELPDYGR